MHQRGSEAIEPPTASSPPLPPRLRDLGARLRTAMETAEPVVLAAGTGLVAALDHLRRLESAFTELTDSVFGENTRQAATDLDAAATRIGMLTEGDSGGAALNDLAGITHGLDKRLSTLSALAGEVGVLAMNAKILAAQLDRGRAEFTVFTAEMQRLGAMTSDIAENTLASLGSLDQAIAEACACSHDFARRSGAEVEALRSRIGHGLDILADRRRKAARAAEDIRRRAHDQAERLSESVRALQIGDITRQRVEHVAEALGLLEDCLTSDGGETARQQALTAMVCALQDQQLRTATEDFCHQIHALAGGLTTMGDDARAMIGEAEDAFGGENGASLGGTLQADVEQAIDLIRQFIVMRARVAEAMSTVQQAVADMVRDLDAITSIRADMHVMGLNAALKCGRLGSEGRALAIVAQELRGCSRRTHEIVLGVGEELDRIRVLEAALVRSAGGRNQDSLKEIVAIMETSLRRVEALSATLEATLGRVRTDGAGAAAVLARTVTGLAAERQVCDALKGVSEQLAELARQNPDHDLDPSDLREDIRHLLSARYTMASERLIHQLVAEGGTPPSAAVADDATPGGLDEFFL